MVHLNLWVVAEGIIFLLVGLLAVFVGAFALILGVGRIIGR